MAKFFLKQDADYVVGHLRYGHREGYIEADSIEDAKKKLEEEGYTDYYKYCEEELNKELDISDDAVWKYINDINEFYEKDVERAYQGWQEELKRVADKNKWMEQFLDSLENI